MLLVLISHHIMSKESTQEFESRHPKTADVVRRIESLLQLDLEIMPDYALKALINSYFNYIPYSSGLIPAGTLLFRARVNKGDIPFSKASEVHYPSRELVTNYGRANRPQEQIFYCSSNLLLAAFETCQNLKHSIQPARALASVTINVYRTLAELHVATIIQSATVHKLRTDNLAAHDFFQNQLNNGVLQADTVTASNLIAQFFAEQFTKSEIRQPSDYKLSVFYTNEIRAMNEMIAPEHQKYHFDGINYPSVAMQYKGDNQALFIESVDSKIELVDALQVLCTNFDFDKADFNAHILHNAKSIENDIIEWNTELYREEAHVYPTLGPKMQ
jgi:RES domain